MIIKSNQKNFVHLVGLYTYRKMMHGSYNIKRIINTNKTLLVRIMYLDVLDRNI